MRNICQNGEGILFVAHGSPDVDPPFAPVNCLAIVASPKASVVCPTSSFARRLCRYDLKLMLLVGVDSENKSVVFAQGFFSDEQTTSFSFALHHFVQICGGHPEASCA